MQRLIQEVEQVTELEKSIKILMEHTQHFVPTEDLEHLYSVIETAEKVSKYENAEEEGRLVVLPCKVGDIIFCLCRIRIHQFKVLSIEIYEYGAILELLYAGDIEKYRFWRIYMQSDDFGRKLFLTSEEAEKALKEREVN